MPAFKIETWGFRAILSVIYKVDIMLNEIELEPSNELNCPTNYSKNFQGTLSGGAKILV